MNLKKVLSCVAAASMCLALFTGCGGEKKQEVVKIGFLAPLTGGNSAIGIGMKNSAQLAVDQVNKSGKYPYKFELVTADDAGDPSTAVAAANKLIADKGVVAVAGHFNSGCGLATTPVFHKAGMPMVVTGAILLPVLSIRILLLKASRKLTALSPLLISKTNTPASWLPRSGA